MNDSKQIQCQAPTYSNKTIPNNREHLSPITHNNLPSSGLAEGIQQRTLAPAQQDVVAADGHCLVNACPGSGKTTVISYRAQHLLQNPTVTIAAVSYGRHAAAQLDQRIRSLAPTAGKRVICGTFHRLAMLQLNAAGIVVDVIFDIHRVNLITGVLREMKLLRSSSAEGVAGIFETHKARGCSVELPPFLQPVFDRYQDELRERKLLDLQDLIARAVDGMRSGLVKPFDVQYLLADEVQDADFVQWEWIHLHADQGTQVTAVGDDDQCIYGWRSARGFAGMAAFRDRYRAKTLLLGTSYRCPPKILETASRLVKANRQRFEKQLVSASCERADVSLIYSTSEDEERSIVAEEIFEKAQLGTCGILARENSGLDHIEVALVERGIAYTRVESTSIWERKGPALLLSLLHGVANGMINGVEPMLIEVGCSLQEMTTLRERCGGTSRGSLDRFVQLPGVKVRKGNKQVRAIREATRRCCDQLERGDLADTIWTAGELAKEIAPDYDNDVIEICCRSIERLKGSLAERVSFLNGKKKLKADNVLLMPMHASKGLEFDHVYIVGCHKAPKEDSLTDVEEERRVRFVAVTRGKKTVHISHSTIKFDPPSRYLKEMNLLPSW